MITELAVTAEHSPYPHPKGVGGIIIDNLIGSLYMILHQVSQFSSSTIHPQVAQIPSALQILCTVPLPNTSPAGKKALDSFTRLNSLSASCLAELDMPPLQAATSFNLSLHSQHKITH